MNTENIYVCIYQISQSKLIKRALPLSRAETSESILSLNDAHTETRRYSCLQLEMLYVARNSIGTLYFSKTV